MKRTARTGPSNWIELYKMVFRISIIFKLLTGKNSSTSKRPLCKDYVARPLVQVESSREFLWANENILVLGHEGGLFEFAKNLSVCGASVSFRFLEKLEDLYKFPLEQYSIVIMTNGSQEPKFSVSDVGRILRRADSELTLVWASDQFRLSMVADAVDSQFCDVKLALPASPLHLKIFLKKHHP